MILIVACGAISASLLVSSVSRNLFSTLIMSFLPCLLLGTFKATVMTLPSLPVMLRARRTTRALPGSMWSMTVPSLILRTRSWLVSDINCGCGLWHINNILAVQVRLIEKAGILMDAGWEHGMLGRTFPSLDSDKPHSK